MPAITAKQWSRRFATASLGILAAAIFYNSGIIAAESQPQTGPSPAAGRNLWTHDSLVAWMVTPPSDSKDRGPEERAQMLETLGFRNYVFRAQTQTTAVYPSCSIIWRRASLQMRSSGFTPR